MTHEYENFLRQNNTGEIERRTSVNPVSAEWIGDDTDSEASYMTDGETNHRRMSMDSDISDISDFSLSDTEDENGDDSDEEDPNYRGEVTLFVARALHQTPTTSTVRKHATCLLHWGAKGFRKS